MCVRVREHHLIKSTLVIQNHQTTSLFFFFLFLRVQKKMAALSKIYTKPLVFLTLLILDLLTLIRSFTGSKPKPETRVITTAQYARLLNDENPATCFVAGKEDPSASSVGCRVCLSRFEDGEGARKLRCGHVFHRECVDTWVVQKQRATCPLCRRKVLGDDVVEGYRRMRNSVELDGNKEEIVFLLSALHGNSFHRLYLWTLVSNI